jgi:molybdate transport system regulatory protein
MSDEPPALEVAADLWLSLGGQNIASARRLTLLAAIAREGSITQAAKAAGLSYKGAWDAIEQMSNLAGEPLVTRVVGGKGGGQTRLTARGQRLVDNFVDIQREHAQFLARLNQRARSFREDFALLENIAMKTSARNQFAGEVQAVQRGAVNDEVTLAVIGAQRIVATITSDSRASLGLEVGTRAIALIKASSIIIMRPDANTRLSARNQLRGTVSRLMPGAVNCEVVLDLAGGGSIAAIVTNDGAQNLELAVGVEAVAVFKASSVILGVAA